MPSIEIINKWTQEEASKHFMSCCGSVKWASAMAKALPFKNKEQMFESATDIWQSLGSSDWLEAFSHHPRIGDKKIAGSNAKWASEEQKQVTNASKAVIDRLNELNGSYEKIFGHVFLLCATGKSAEEMLSLLEKRIKNLPDEELRIAAGEQSKITQLRLEKLLKS